MTTAAVLAQMGSNNTTFRNRIINGAMMIDQRNAGASVTPSTESYTLDRWLLRQPSGIYSIQQQSSTIPANFSSAIRLAVASVQGSIAAGTVNNLTQYIEGLNTSDLGWGTASASAVTLSFWVRSSVTGTYSTCLYNNGFTRAYVATYQVNSANTWEFKTITIPGDTAGTWATNNQVGIALAFDLGSGSNYNGTAGVWGAGALKTSGSVNLSTNSGATFYITGVQLEAGTNATPFEFRPYGTELALCQRYFEKSYDQSVKPGTASSGGYVTSVLGTNTVAAGQTHCTIFFAVEKRTSSPTMTCYGYSGGTSVVSNGATGADLAANSGVLNTRDSRLASFYNNGGSLTTSTGSVIFHFTADAEL